MIKEIKTLKKELKNADLKITPARLAAMEVFTIHKKPIDAQHIINDLQKGLTVDRVTVYRMLNTFSEKNLIRKISFGENKTLYELNISDHHHLICQKCKRVEDVADCDISSFEKNIKKRKGFAVSSHSLEFFGICVHCQ